MTTIRELVHKVIIIIVHMFKKVEKSISIIKGDMKSIKMT